MQDDGAVDIVHVDAAFLVALKPAGLLAVPGRTEADCLALRVRSRFADALVVHRLDMATSGLMLFARGQAAQRGLSRAFAERRVDKRYAAIVHGRPAPDRGEIDLALGADWPNRPKQKVDTAHGKPSLTRYRVVGFDAAAGVSLLELEPVTGRAHQLRVHLLAIGHPVVGDALYAPAADGTASRLMLHAEHLSFAHPATGERVSFTSPAAFALSTTAEPPDPDGNGLAAVPSTRPSPPRTA